MNFYRGNHGETNQSQAFRSAMIHCLNIYRGEFIKVNGNKQIFRIDFVGIHYHLCEISAQIIEYKIFLLMNSLYQLITLEI